MGAITGQRFTVVIQRRPAKPLTLELGAAHASTDPLNDQRSFQLGDGADDDDDRAAQRAAGIELLAEADELDVQPTAATWQSRAGRSTRTSG